MRLILIVCVCFCVLSAQKCNDKPTHRVNIVLTKTESYCGGAEPPEELLTELNTPKPYNSGKVYILDDLKACVDSITPTNVETLVPLKTGHYTAHLVAKLKDLESITSEDEQCITAFKQRILAMFEIKGDMALQVNLHFGCNPCYPPPP